MSARVRPVHGRPSAVLSIFIASTRFSEGTGSPVNGDRSWAECDGEGVAATCLTVPRLPSTSSAPTTRSVRTMAAPTVKVILCRVHAMAHPAPAKATVGHEIPAIPGGGTAGGHLPVGQLPVGQHDPDLAQRERHPLAGRGGESGAAIGGRPRPVHRPRPAVAQDDRAAGPGALRERRPLAVFLETRRAHGGVLD